MTSVSVFLLWGIGVVFCLFGVEHPMVSLMRQRCVGVCDTGSASFLCVVVHVLEWIVWLCVKLGHCVVCFVCDGCVGMRWE